ncbi:hypothetical protein ACIRU8_15025 [Streptomyces sp. NPDC101175]|uniref:hypothetical protein n=1 Tax=Streptomyces sp. NPDC101175 TaxID=3366123 RepID=UPI00383935A6
MEQSQNPFPEPFEAPEALLITGDALRDMTPDRLETISQVLGVLGLRMTTIADLESFNTSEEEPEPVPASRDDFLRFAEENGHTERLAKTAWHMVQVTGAQGERGFKYHAWNKDDEEPTGFPALEFTHNQSGDRAVDLWTVNERLKSGGRYEKSRYVGAWSHRGEGKFEFLRALCAEKLSLDTSEPEDK